MEQSGCIGVLSVPNCTARYHTFLAASPALSRVTTRPEQSFVWASTGECPLAVLAELSQRAGFSRTCTKLLACDRRVVEAELRGRLHGSRIRVHCDTRQLQERIQDWMEESGLLASCAASLAPQSFEHILSLIPLHEVGPECWAVGVWTAAQYEQHCMAGQRAPAAGLVGLNHAEYKMREAMQSLQQEGAPVPLSQPASRAGRQIVRQHAVDVGAAPGGWTRFLAQTEGFELVTAIDPGELHPDVAGLENVTHVQLPAQEVAGLPRATLLVCDVNRDPRDTARDMLVPLAEILEPGSPLVLTMKLPKRLPLAGVQKWAEDTQAILEPWFERFRVVWLFGNTSCERTMICVRRYDPA